MALSRGCQQQWPYYDDSKSGPFIASIDSNGGPLRIITEWHCLEDDNNSGPIMIYVTKQVCVNVTKQIAYSG